MGKYKSFFPKDGSWESFHNGVAFQIKTPNASSEAKQLVEEVNEYLRRNEGTTDFNIIKDKTERSLDTLYEDAMSKVSFPTYLGLMGTFFGVFIGLKSFNIGVATSGVSDEIVSELIGGVIVSMVTSLIGLALMMVGNWIASDYQKKVEADKNKFYDFLQVQLMPVMGTSMVAALHKLHGTINTFEPAFRSIIDEFKSAFGECTETLKGTFGENVKQLTDAVEVMGRNMTTINENVKKQDELLKTMRQRQTLETLEKFNEAADKFDSVSTSIAKLTDIKDEIAKSSQDLVKAQNDFVGQMTIPERVFEKVNTILNRVTTFEESINALGTNIAQTQLLGNTQMNLIQEQITAIQKKTNLAVAYQELADEDLKNLFETQKAAINALNAKYKAAIEQHGEDFADAMETFKKDFERIVNECKQAVEDKRSEYIAEINKSIDLEANNKHLAHLDKLDEILSGLTTIKASVKDQATVPHKLDEMKTQIANIKVQGVSTGMSSSANNGAQNPYVGQSRPYVPPTTPNAGQRQPQTPLTQSQPKEEEPKSRGGLFGLFGRRK
ncbi:MAG: hypothetical protein ACI3ZS_08740 [Candidatus Cryptobacteroides sp.]